MRLPALLLSVAACGSASRPVAQPVAQPAAPATVDLPAAEPKRYVVPAHVAEALANEPLAGNVLVPALVELHPTAASARADATPARGGAPIAMQVVADHGDVVQLSTARVQDCAAAYGEAYELAVFVKRDKLMPRTKVDLTKAFFDGTAIAIDRGAPIDTWLTATITPKEAELTYALVPTQLPTATLPEPRGERLVCEEDRPPMTLSAWEREQRRAHAVKARAERDARRLARERLRVERARAWEAARERAARREREREECERQQRERERAAQAKAKAKAKAKTKKRGPKTAHEQALEDAIRSGVLGKMGKLGTCGIAGAFDSGFEDVDPSMDYFPYDAGWDVYDPTSVHVPYCGATGAAKLGGVRASWPSPTTNEHVVRRGRKYLADIGYRCGRVRVAVEAVRAPPAAGAADLGSGDRVFAWIPKPGPVTWPDGTLAGKFTGFTLYQNVVEKGDRICVKVTGIAELVCHDRKTTASGMVPASAIR